VNASLPSASFQGADKLRLTILLNIDSTLDTALSRILAEADEEAQDRYNYAGERATSDLKRRIVFSYLGLSIRIAAKQSCRRAQERRAKDGGHSKESKHLFFHFSYAF
jgi:hypothetical protein